MLIIHKRQKAGELHKDHFAILINRQKSEPKHLPMLPMPNVPTQRESDGGGGRGQTAAIFDTLAAK